MQRLAIAFQIPTPGVQTTVHYPSTDCFHFIVRDSDCQDGGCAGNEADSGDVGGADLTGDDDLGGN